MWKLEQKRLCGSGLHWQETISKSALATEKPAVMHWKVKQVAIATTVIQYLQKRKGIEKEHYKSKIKKFIDIAGLEWQTE